MSTELGSTLLKLSRAAIGSRFGGGDGAVAPALPELAQPGATFVTLTMRGELRGCIGSLEARRLLRDDVQHNALAAAFRDPRFPPLERRDFDLVRIEVSLLAPPERMEAQNEDDALGQLRPGTDGLIFMRGANRATFLPQVWESLPDPRHFMMQLKRKAGLPADFWSGDVELARYTVTKWKEPTLIPTK